jgi:DNA repair protein RadC
MKFNIHSEEGQKDRTEISLNGIGSVTLVETFPEYEFIEDVDEDTLEELGVEEGDLIGKIEHIVVNDEHKGKGYGRLLMNKAIEVAKEKGLMPLYLNASPMGYDGLDIDDLTGFYESFGFEVFLQQGRNNLMILKDTYKIGGQTKNKIMEKQMKMNFENGGVTYSEWLKEDSFQEEFNNWMEDDNVIKNPDGTYSTQDAQYRNSLKDMSELQMYFYKEFIEGQYAEGGEADSFGKGGNVSSIEKRVEEVNKLIELANANDISVIDSSTTWQSPMKYKPIRYSNGVLYVEYQELDLYKYNRTGESNWVTKKDKVLKRNMEFDNPLNDIAKMYRKALRESDIDYKSAELNKKEPKKEDIGFDDEGTNMVMYHEEKGNFMIPKGQIYLWLYEGEKIGEKLQNEEYDWVFYPYANINMAFQKGFIPPLKRIWTKKFQKDHKGSEHLLGVIKAYLIEKEGQKELYIDMMSVNPTKMKKGIMSYMIKELRDTFNLTQDQITFSKLTPEGEKFVAKKTYADGGWVLVDADTERKLGEYETESEARKMMYEYEGNSNILEKSFFDKLPPNPNRHSPAYNFADGGKVLASSSSKEGINKLIEQYLYGSTITLVQTDNDKIYEVHNKKGKTSFYVELSRGKYKFIQPSMYDNGGDLEENSNRNETQENNFGVSYKLGDKFTLGRKFGNKDEQVSITEIMPSGLFFKVDKSSKVFSIKTLHSRGSTYTSGEYLVPIKKEYADGGKTDKWINKIVRRKNLRGGYNNYEIMYYDEMYEKYRLKDLEKDLTISATTKEIKNEFEFVDKYEDGGEAAEYQIIDKKTEKYYSRSISDGKIKWNDSPDMGYMFTMKDANQIKESLHQSGYEQLEVVKYDANWWRKAKYEKGGAIYPDLSLQKADVVNDSVELNEFEIKKMKNTFKINGMENTKITSSQSAVKILRELFSQDTINAYEEAYILYLNKNNKVIGYYHHSSGGIDGTVMDVQMISGMALKSLAKGVIIAHNHPSENTQPSDADKKITNQLKDALKLFNIYLMDSIILTDDSFFSFSDDGLL